VESAAQSHLQAVSDKSDENVRFNPLLELMVDRADSQITLEIAEGLFNLGQLDIKLPQPRRIDSNEFEKRWNSMRDLWATPGVGPECGAAHPAQAGAGCGAGKFRRERLAGPSLKSRLLVAPFSAPGFSRSPWIVLD
jgi:hypothetical protein